MCAKLNLKTRYIESEDIDVDYDYIIYTDGGYSLQKDLGAFAFIILDKSGERVIKTFAKKIEHESNNRAELKAIMAAIYLLPSDAYKICIISDSQYSLKTCSGVWQQKKNTDLFDWLDSYLEQHPLDITYKWVRGHNGNKWNEECDRMCNKAAGMDLNAEFAKYKK